MPYLCWIYNDDIQQEFIGINKCVVDMLNASPHGKGDIWLIAHNSDYGCIFIYKMFNLLWQVVGFYILKQPIITKFVKQ